MGATSVTKDESPAPNQQPHTDALGLSIHAGHRLHPAPSTRLRPDLSPVPGQEQASHLNGKQSPWD